MFNFENISLNFAFPSFYFFIALLVLAGYTIYIYRFTIPPVGKFKKNILVTLRTLALLLLLFAFFEPVLSFAKKKILEPVNMVFVDNSRSIRIKDGMGRAKTEIQFVKDLQSNGLSTNTELYTFGTKITGISFDSIQQINFTEGSTDFSNIFSFLNRSNRNISSVVIVSDGVITEGADPLHVAERLNIPVYTVGVGDTTKRNDILVKNVLHNDLIYAETPTTIMASIANTGFTGKNVLVSLYENNKPVDQKTVALNGSGIQNIYFTYTPKSSGEKKLTVTVSDTKGEFTYANNKKLFYINVLSNKVKVLVLAGSPSSDVSFIKNTLRSDKNLTVNSVIQTAPGKFIENNNRQTLLDSADVLFLVGFPSEETPQNLMDAVLKAVSEKDKPYFISLSEGVDFSRLKQFQSQLPFTIKNINSDYLEIQPEVSADDMDNPLFQNNASDPVTAWNNLPPVYQPNVDMQSKPESRVLSKVKVNNIPMNRPLILTRILGKQKSIAVLAKDIWRWKLETVPQGLDLFDRFILASVKWLNSKDVHKQVAITTSKKTYSLGEPVEFSAQVYDQSFNPVSNAEVRIIIKSGEENFPLNLNSLGSGLYEGKFSTDKAGDYTFSGAASLRGTNFGTDKGRFNVGEVDIEMMNPVMNYEYLALLAHQTNGRFFYNSDYKGLFKILENRNKKSSKEKIEVSDVNLWSNEWLLISAVLLFGLEWFLRKRSGML